MDARMTKALIKDFSGICFETLCRTLLSVLLMVLLTGMAFSILRAGFDLVSSSDLYTAAGLHNAIKELIVNVLMVLALLELFRTVKAYFTEGRIKVTYIIDTALVVVITDIMGFWYREIEVARIALAIALVVALMGVRIMAILYSPRRSKLLEEL
jgi:uncharacterized membrane protein (DUF373 family)